MASQPARLRALYRALLRELPPRPVLASPRPPLHQRIRDHFHHAASAAAPTSASTSTSTSAPSSSSSSNSNHDEHAVAQAEQFLAYFRAQRTYTALLERYNPGMGMDEEERVRLTARRVGMDLPQEYEK